MVSMTTYICSLSKTIARLQAVMEFLRSSPTNNSKTITKFRKFRIVLYYVK